ncbi:hypothetical protein Goshw_005146 [Gossypium schwendimanii]|uniref:Zinc knuckle CX2CX4HX4C domain-containing protein n=1 Tax=Gossypium schwendimanii TaxID=34291 RepID=A0A7J9N1P0_GOSSC|nr:hypothetical protein [Gossypium schwendimanii]
MMDSGGNDGFGGDEISLLAEELIQLSVKASMVEPKEDLETILEGQPWLFRKSLVIFDRLTKPVERSQISLVSSPFWIKIGPCLPEFDKKDLLHGIGVTFGGVLRSEINGEFCRLRVNLNVQKSLRRGIFVLRSNGSKYWLPFKYEKLPKFCFGCGLMGHDLQDCTVVKPAEKDKIREDPSFSLALKAELNLTGKECLKFNAIGKKLQSHSLYTGGVTTNQETCLFDGINGGQTTLLQKEVRATVTEIEKRESMEGEKDRNNSEEIKTDGKLLQPIKKSSWRRLKPSEPMECHDAENFNEIMYSFEKKGGQAREERRMEAFRGVLGECQLVDVGYTGVWYTWERGNLPSTNIRERLDRGVANEKWLEAFHVVMSTT